jgi:hypothetical protein
MSSESIEVLLCTVSTAKEADFFKEEAELVEVVIIGVEIRVEVEVVEVVVEVVEVVVVVIVFAVVFLAKPELRSRFKMLGIQASNI